MNFRVLTYLSWRQLMQRRVQTLLAILGIAAGVALQFSIHLINQSILQNFRNSVESVAGQSSLFVSAGETGFDEKLVPEVIEKTPGVRFAIPVIEARTFVFSGPHASESIMIMGVDLLRERNVRSYRTTDEEVLEDPLMFFNQPDSLIITKSLSERLGVKIDDTLKLSTTLGSRDFTVRGILSASGVGSAFGGGLGIMDIDGAQVTFGKIKKIDRADIVVAPGVDVNEVALRLKSALGSSFVVERPQSRTERTERMIESFQFMLSFFSSLSLMIGIVLVYTMVSRFVSERRQEIGTYRTLGATRSLILVGCIAIGIIQGMMGGGLGAFLSVYLSNQLLSLIATSLSSQYDLVVSVDQIRVDWLQILKATLLGTGISGIAALIPSWRASRLAPVEAMRTEVPKISESTVSKKSAALQICTGLVLIGISVICFTTPVGTQGSFFPLLAQVCMVAGTLLLVSCLSIWGIFGLIRMLGWRFGRATRLGLENVVRNPKQAAQNSAMITAGLLILCFVQGAAGSFRHSIHQWMNREVYWDLGVVSAGDMMSFRVQPLDPSIAKEIAAIPGVETLQDGKLFGVRMSKIWVDNREVLLEAHENPGLQQPPLEVRGLASATSSNVQEDPRAKKIRDILFQSEDPAIGDKVSEMFQSPELKLLASDGFMRQSRRKIGDRIQIPTPTGTVEGLLIGVVNDFSFAGGSLYMDRSKYQKLWNDPLITVFGVKVLPGFQIDEVRRAIDSQLAQKRNLMVISNKEMRDQMGEELDRSLAFMDALQYIILLIVVIGLVNTFLVTILERRREIGMLRAIGMTRLQLAVSLLSERLIQGGFCSLLTILIGIPITKLWVRLPLSELLGWSLQFNFPWEGMFKIISVGLLVSGFAALIPMFHATRIQITEALRYE